MSEAAKKNLKIGLWVVGVVAVVAIGINYFPKAKAAAADAAAKIKGAVVPPV